MKTETKLIVMTMVFALALGFTGMRSAYAVPSLDPMTAPTGDELVSAKRCDPCGDCKAADDCDQASARCEWKGGFCIKLSSAMDMPDLATEVPAEEASAPLVEPTDTANAGMSEPAAAAEMQQDPAAIAQTDLATTELPALDPTDVAMTDPDLVSDITTDACKGKAPGDDCSTSRKTGKCAAKTGTACPCLCR